MAKEDNGFAWDTMWAAFRGQPTNIQRAWMMGNGGLYPHLKDAMVRYPKRVQDDIFEFAPLDVQEHFGYITAPEPEPIPTKFVISKEIQDRLRKSLAEVR